MVVSISSADPRSIRALAVLETASRWQKGHTKAGRKFYAVPSQSEPGLLHMTDCRACSCRDFQRTQQPCKHVLAVRLHVERVKAVRYEKNEGNEKRAAQPQPVPILAHERRIGKVFQSDDEQ